MRMVFFAFIIAKAKGFSKVCGLLDAKEVVGALNGRCDWASNPIISDIKDLVSSFVYVRFSFVPRSKNEGTHMLAKLNYSLNQNFILDWGRD